MITHTREDHNALILLSATAWSRVGDVVSAVALVVVVADRTRSPAWLAAAGMARLLPALLLGAPAGALANRVNRRALAVASDLGRAVLLAATTVLVLSHAPLVLVLSLAALTSAVGTLHRPALVALVPDAVGPDRLGRTNASFAVIENVVCLAGPLVAGVAVVTGAPAMAFALDGATFLVSAALVRKLVVSPIGPQLQTSRGRARWDPQTRVVVMALAAAALVYGHETVLLALFAQRRLGSAASLGLLESAVAVGGLLAAWPAARLARRVHPMAVLVPALGALGLPLAVLAVVSTPLAACGALMVEGAANVVVDVVALTVIQRRIPSSALAGVTGLMDSMMAGCLLVGVATAPLTVGAFGLSGALVMAGLALPAAAVGPLRSIQMRTSSSSASAASWTCR